MGRGRKGRIGEEIGVKLKIWKGVGAKERVMGRMGRPEEGMGTKLSHGWGYGEREIRRKK